MHKFITADDIVSRDFGSSKSAAPFAQKIIGRDAVVVRRENDETVYWMSATHAASFGGEVVNTAAALRDGHEADRAAAQEASNAFFVAKAGPAARRVNHVKFGEGTVVSEDAKAWTVIFTSQKKPIRVVPAALEVLA